MITANTVLFSRVVNSVPTFESLDLSRSDILIIPLSGNQPGVDCNSLQPSGARLDTIGSAKLVETDINYYDLVVVMDDDGTDQKPLRSLMTYIGTVARTSKVIIVSGRPEDPELARSLIHTCDAIIGCPMEHSVFVSTVEKLLSKASNFPMRHFDDDSSRPGGVRLPVSMTLVAGLMSIAAAALLTVKFFVL